MLDKGMMKDDQGTMEKKSSCREREDKRWNASRKSCAQIFGSCVL